MDGKILIIDDNRFSRELYTDGLKSEGFDVFSASSRSAGIKLARTRLPDLIVLSLVNSRLDGAAICRAVKEESSTAGIQILILCLSDRAGQELLCRMAGADDYMVDVNADVDLFLVRCRTLLRRTHGPAIKRGRMTILVETREVRLGEASYTCLTQREFEVLHLLAKRSPRIVSAISLYRELWGCEPPIQQTLKGPKPNLKTVDVHIARIRRKLSLSNWLKIKPKAGYQLLDVNP